MPDGSSRPESALLAELRRAIEAAGGASQVQWAAGAVVVGPSCRLVLTSDRGRGWMPAGAILPAVAVSPWDPKPWSGAHPDTRRWEGLRDPARVIVECAAAIGGRLIALASSHGGAPAAIAGIPWTVAKATDHSHPELFGSDAIVTRWERGVAKGLQRQAAAVDADQARARALWAAWEAHGKIGGGSAARSRLIGALDRDVHRLNDLRWLNSLDWEELEAEYVDLCWRERVERLDVADVPIGDVDSGGAGRYLLGQAYATEALLAVRAASPEMALREALYAWAMALAIRPDRVESRITPLAG